MFENIEKARQLLKPGTFRAAIDEFFKLINELKSKGNDEEACRLLLEITSSIAETNDRRLIFLTTEGLLRELDKLKVKDADNFYGVIDAFLANVKELYRKNDEQFEKAAQLSEIQLRLYDKVKRDTTNITLAAANDYANLAAKALAKARLREEDEKQGQETIKKAIKLYEKAKHEEKAVDIYIKIFDKHMENRNEELAEKYLDQAVNFVLGLKADETKILAVTEQLMHSYVTFVEFKISEILSPEQKISKVENVQFENNIATRILGHAKDICVNRKAKPAILILAKELSLIGLALFEKGLSDVAIPYYEAAKDYYVEVGIASESLDFGSNVTSIGLQLYTDERYPIGRDYFRIAIELGRNVDREFEVDIYKKQAELLLKYNKFQLAYESLRMMIDPLKDLPESDMRSDAPSMIRQLAQERFSKNDFHYAELFYRLVTEFFIAFDQIDLAADTFDAAWQSMFEVRQLQTGIDLASKAANFYLKTGKEEEASEVYFKLAERLMQEGHLDIGLDRLKLAAETIPENLHEQKFKPLVEIATKYTDQCIKSGDIINARELWKAACEFNEILARSLIKRDINAVVETIEEHISNVRKFDTEELNEVTMESARGSGKVLAEAGENERAAKVLVGFATDFLRKNITEYADPLFEQGAEEFIKANQPEEAARVLSALSRYHSENGNDDKAIHYYLLASVDSDMKVETSIFHSVAEHCFETYSNQIEAGAIEIAEKGFETTIRIELAVSKEAAANRASSIAKLFVDKNEFVLSIKYYQQAINYYLESSPKSAIALGAEIIERGREIFQKKLFEESNNFIILGLEALNKADQKIQAAQTARIEGERFLDSSVPHLGIDLLNKAVAFYLELNDKSSAAELHVTLSKHFISANDLEHGLREMKVAGDILLTLKKPNELKKIINIITDISIEIAIGKITSTKEGEDDREKISQSFFAVGEDFSRQIGDLEFNSEVKYREWTTYSKEHLHNAAHESLKKTFEAYIDLKNNKRISELATEVTNFSTDLISKEDLVGATKYLNLSISILQKINKYEEAAAICIRTCEEFLKLENNEVAVSWGIRGAEILTEVQIVDEAIQFLEELVNVLMARNSIENAILCYGKIAKILELNGRMKEVEETALKVMAFGTANMKNNNPEAGLRLWEVALTIGAIVGEEFTGRLCIIEGQTFYEIKNYEKSIDLFKESFGHFNRTGKPNRLINLGNAIFDIAYDLQKNMDFDTSFRYLPIAFEALIAGNELMLATDKMFGNAKNFIEIGKDKEGYHIINTSIDTLFSKGDITSGVERCFVGAALLISYGKNVEGSRLIDKGMEKTIQITDEAATKHLATVCRNQGIILRDEGKLEASHIMFASGIGILRTINDLVGIGQISIDLGETLIKRNEMNAAVEAFRNGIQLLARGGLGKEASDITNNLITEGRKQIDNSNIIVGVPLVELSGELFISLGQPERIMVISEIFINLGGKMLNERNNDFAALYFSKAMELASQAGLNDYLPKVGNRCIDFGLKLVKEGDPLLGIQFMNAGADLISEFEKKPEKASRATSNYLEAISQVLSPAYEKIFENEEDRMVLIGQFVDSTSKFFSQIQAAKDLEQLTKLLLDYGKKLLRTKDPQMVRRIFEPALRAADSANNTKLQIEIGNAYLSHVSYLIEKKQYKYLETTVNQALNIYIEVNELKEIRKFMGIMTHTGRELSLDPTTHTYGIKILTMLSDLATSLTHQELYPVTIIPLIHLNQQALEQENYELLIFARQNIIRLLQSILNANYSLAILGNISLSNMIYEWFKSADEMIAKSILFDQSIKIIDQSLQLAVITQEVELGMAVIDKTYELIETVFKRKVKGIDVLYEILAIALVGLGQRSRVVELGTKCLEYGKEAAERKRLMESISLLKTAGRVFALLDDERLIADTAIASATIGDLRLRDKNFKEGLYYYSAALENYELSRDEKSIQLIAKTIQDLHRTAPREDGYLSFEIPGMVFANRDNVKDAEAIARSAIDLVDKMIKSGKKDVIYDSIPYIFAASKIYDRTGNFIEETKVYDTHMFQYISATNDAKIVELFLDMLIRSITKKLRIWDFNAIQQLFDKIKDQKILKNKRYQAITSSIDELLRGHITEALDLAREVNVLFERCVQEYFEIYKEQIKEDIRETGKLSIHDYMRDQPISDLVNVLIQDLYGRKEIEGKYFPIGLFVSGKQLEGTINTLDKELADKGKAVITEVAQNTALTLDEAMSVILIEYLPQKFQAALNEDYSIIYSYLQLRNEVKDLALGFQEIGNIDINKISQQLKFPPETIQREIEYLILEGKINPRLVGRTT
ncbi:MAG: hypothetical protein KGD59_06165 [Candidatus Heimdallarchaeota archaeon]|nr:hypothetical protein [Candidatus Heimdallarchaeota archaeon]MBY8994117.1 hypothetical protein [Candidatus Heimdallarchaeota archaeon]